MKIQKTQKIHQSQKAEIKVVCSECNKKTSHNVISSVENNFCQGFGYDEQLGYEPSDFYLELYEIIECKGCETVSFRKFGVYDYPDNCVENLYPLRIEGRKGLDEDTDFLPVDVKRIYLETLKALNSEIPILTGIGLRALVETVCKEKKAKGKDLYTKIDDLIELKVLTPNDGKALQNIRELGNDSAHEVKSHHQTLLEFAMDIVENLLKAVYILPKQRETLFTEFNKE
jgi:hypothetical protein